MKIAKVTGTITATVKSAQLTGKPLLITDVINGTGKVLEAAIVAIDTVGAGVGDTVLLVQGSAARMPEGTASAPTDTTIIAIVDHVSISKT